MDTIVRWIAWLGYWVGLAGKPKRRLKKKRMSFREYQQSQTRVSRTHLVLGSLLILVPLCLVATTLVLTYDLSWVFSTGVPAAPQNPLPPPVASPTPQIQATEWWQATTWLDQQPASNLRHQNNVVNLALLKPNGSVLYHSQLSLSFSPNSDWETATIRPPGFQNMAVNGTQLNLGIGNRNYTLNIYQPFTLQDSAHTFYLVDFEGTLWQISSDTPLEPVEAVQSQLSQPLSVNPNLSLTY